METMDEPKALKILLVDDAPLNLALVSKVFSRKGHGVCAVESGEKALAAFQKEHFDVILVDMQMPVMDGLETTRQIRKLEAGEEPSATVPIIAMTANDLESDKQKCFAAGMDGFITKPLVISEVVHTVQKIIAERRPS